MTIASIRKKLLAYLARAEDKKVTALYTLFEDEINRTQASNFTDDHIKILDKRRTRHLSSTDKSTSREQAHETIRKKRKSNRE